MPSQRLTEAFCANAETASSQDTWYFDSEIGGFALRVRAGGGKSFYIRYRTKGNRTFKKLHLGPFVRGSVEQARKLARKEMARISLGADPAGDRRAAKLGERVYDLFPRFLQFLRSRSKPWTLQQYSQLYRQHIGPHLGKAKVADLSRQDIARLHAFLASTPTAANRTVAVLSSFLAWAIKQGFRGQSNPCLGLDKYPESKKGRRLNPEEYQRLWEALEGLQTECSAHRTTFAMVKLLLLTGLRPNEASELRWGEIDRQGGWIHLRDSKTGESGRPLSDHAACILGELTPAGPEDRVFGGQDGQSLYWTLQRLWPKLIRPRAGLPAETRLYDLRHSFLTTGAAEGISAPILKQVAGHSSINTTQYYIHVGGAKPVKEAAERITSSIAAAWGGRKGRTTTTATHLRLER